MITTHLSLYVAADVEQMAEQAALLMVEQSKAAIAERGVFSLAISGGKTPLPLFRLLSHPDWASKIDWANTMVYWVDERCVSIESEESNYRAARQELLSKVEATRFYRMKGEEHPEKAALDYEKLLQEHFSLKEGELPRFDCVILGVGEDGHTASLYPGDPAMGEKKRLVMDAYIPKLKKSRLTVTLPVLNNSRCCVFLASGKEKNHVLTTALNLMAAPMLPAQMVRPHNGKLCWIIDNTAYQG